MNLKLLLALSLQLFAMNAWAEHVGDASNSSASERAVPSQALLPIGSPDLRGTGWEGTFTQSGIENTIRVGFLNEVTSNGEIPYFAYIPQKGASSEVIGALDKTCDFTPRLAKFSPGDPITGEIKVYKCADSPSEEKSLAQDPKRPAVLQAKVTKFELEEGGSTIHMEALIKGLPVTYELRKQELPPEARTSRSDMHAWVVQ